MGKKRIKYLNRRKSREKIKKIIYTITSIFIILTLSISVNYLKEKYVPTNVEDSRIEFYMDIADEVGMQKIQINWKELLALDMVIYENDLKNVKKIDVLKRAKNFVELDKSKNRYELKSLDYVTDKLEFTIDQKKEVNKNLRGLQYVFLGNKKMDEKSDEMIFINKIKEPAIENYNEYGILPSITISQCILESGWGKSSLAEDGKNLFGIKANSSWDGKRIEMKTSENYNDKIIDTFRVYDSISESIKDHGKFLSENSRYEENGLFEAKHYTTQAQALEDAGYSTKKNKYGEKIYADMIIDLVRRYNLQLIDWEVCK